MALSKEDVCVMQITVRSGGSDGLGDVGDLREIPLREAIEIDEENQASDDDGSGDKTEQWKEVARTIEPLELEGGTEVDRIIRSTFEKPSGKRIELVFAEAQPDVDVSDITTKA